MVDFGLRGFWFEYHRRHCILSLNKTLYPVLSIGSTNKDKKDVLA